MPLRERNAMLLAAGYAPVFPERPLADPSMEAARRTIQRQRTTLASGRLRRHQRCERLTRIIQGNSLCLP